jgi:hypothetical protein
MQPLGQGSLLDELESSTPAGAPQARRGGSAGGGGGGSPGVDKWRYAKVVGSVVVVALSAWFISRQVGAMGNPSAETNRTTLMDGETGELFGNYRLRAGDQQPFPNPSTGRRTLYYTEKCFWTRDGKAKLTPTLVIPNQFMGKPGDAMCPDCGRKVVPRNPPPPMELMSEAAQRQSEGK